MEYSRKERDTINRAWSWLREFADRHHHDLEELLDTALGHERKARESTTVAKAMIVRSAVEDRGSTAAELYALAMGLRLAAIAGAAMADRWPEEWGEMVPVLLEGIEAHESRQARWLEEIKS